MNMLICFLSGSKKNFSDAQLPTHLPKLHPNNAVLVAPRPSAVGLHQIRKMHQQLFRILRPKFTASTNPENFRNSNNYTISKTICQLFHKLSR
jgi:hypothetical protein